MQSRHRRSIRLPGFDYSQPGFYFVTVCSFRRRPRFGRVEEETVVLSSEGEIVWGEWFCTASIRDYVNLIEGEFVIMPNHIHGIIHLTTRVGARRRRALTRTEQFGSPVAGSLSTVIRAFKSQVTRRINAMNRTPGRPVWMSGIYEHIIRNDRELNNIRRYIDQNPLHWSHDRYHHP